MDKYPVREEDGRVAGELTVQREGLYTVFSVSCAPRPGLWCAWVRGQRDDLRIGVLEPQAGSLCIRRRFSPSGTAPLGAILEGRLRPRGEPLEGWRPLDAPERYFQSPLLLRSLSGRAGVLTCRAGAYRRVAVPRDDAAPFPIEAMFCFAAPRQLGAQGYWVFTFDGGEWPVTGDAES